MHDVNGWMMALAFLLGLLLTFAMMIRRVTREVPVSHTVTAAIPELKKPELKKPHLDETKTELKAAGAAVAAGAAAKLHTSAEKVEHGEKRVETAVHKVAEAAGERIDERRRGDVIEAVPYGAGSIRVTSRISAPAGYTVKGDKDTGRYFTLDSPEYQTIEAEVWFINEESAQKAGFVRWDATGDRPVSLVPDTAAAVITEQHVQAETVITEDHSDGDASIVIIDSGAEPPASTVRVVAAGEDD